MNKTFFILLVFISNFGLGQNLVPNHSFEDTLSCPSGMTSISSVAVWFNPTQASPDYYNVCGTSSDNGVPTNSWGYQNAQDGNAYVGIIPYAVSIVDYREYLEVKLTQKLVASKTYYWCMYVSLLDSTDYVSNNIGISLSNTLILASTSQSVLNLSVYGNYTTLILDNINWTKIYGSFVANGGEEYLIIGNFFNDAQTTALQVQQNSLNGESSYYYIDNVYLGEAICEESEIENSNNDTLHVIIPNIITPNNDNHNDSFYLNFPYTTLVIYNRWGQKIFDSNNNEASWNGRTTSGNNVPDGTYYYVVTTTTETYKGFVQVIR